MREAIVLAGGLGTRLAGVIPDIPKAMADIAGRPFLAWQLDYLCANGFDRVILSIGYRGDQIVATIGRRYGELEIDYARETSALGTGGAIRHALSLVRARGVHVFNGDTLVAIDVAALEGRAGERLVIGALLVEDAARYGALAIEDNCLIGFAEKRVTGPACVNAGAYWVSANLFDGFRLSERFSFEEDFLRPLAQELRPRVVQTSGPMIDIGIPESLANAQRLVPDLVRYVRLQR
jgi:D-glycero-alpha-D-manno-heptose 1-phosphate guanylyltransferase